MSILDVAQKKSEMIISSAIAKAYGYGEKHQSKYRSEGRERRTGSQANGVRQRNEDDVVKRVAAVARLPLDVKLSSHPLPFCGGTTARWLRSESHRASA